MSMEAILESGFESGDRIENSQRRSGRKDRRFNLSPAHTLPYPARQRRPCRNGEASAEAFPLAV